MYITGYSSEVSSFQANQLVNRRHLKSLKPMSPRFSACPLCVAAVGTVAASSVASYAAGQKVSGSQVAVASGISTIAGSALGGLIYATHILEPVNLLGSVLIGMLTSGLGTWAVLSTQKSPEKPPEKASNS